MTKKQKKINDFSSLMQVCKFSDKMAEIKELVKKGADVNEVDNLGNTPLIYAVKYNSNPEVTKFLIEQGAEDNVVKSKDYGHIPLIYASEHTPKPEIINILVQNGADLNAVYFRNFTALMKVSEHMDVAYALVNNGADPFVVNGFDHDVLSNTVTSDNNPEIIEMLLQIYCKENMFEKHKKTILFEVCNYGHANLDIVDLLIKYGADVNSVDEFNHTVLMNAIKNETFDIVKLLVENGANVHAVSDYDQDMLHFFAQRKNVDIDMFNFLKSEGLDTLKKDELGATLLLKAADNNPSVEKIKLFLAEGIDINESDCVQQTPLSVACGQYGASLDVVSFLVENGANVNDLDFGGRTPLIQASTYAKDPEIINYLLENNADVNIKDFEGRDALYYIKLNTALEKSEARTKLEMMSDSMINRSFT